jgi:hypothetical protein
MRLPARFLTSIVLAAAFASPVIITGCSARVGYRVHDPYYNDDHVWNNDEVVFYNRWEGETHRGHVDYRHRPAGEQKEYWDWRHNHH